MRTLILLLLATLPPVLAAETETYFFGFLKSAPNRPTLPKEEAAKIQAAHLAHLGKMNEKGALMCAGPLDGGGVYRGVILYRTPTVAEAEAMANADPAVVAGLLVTEFYQWTGPKGIGEDFRKRSREAGGKLEMKMTKYHLLLRKPGTPSRHEQAAKTGKLVAAGPYRPATGDGAAGEIVILESLPAEEFKTLAGEGAQLALDWYVAAGVLPAAH